MPYRHIATIVCVFLSSVAAVRGETPAETFRALGGQVREDKGVFVELNIDVKHFTPDDYRKLGACETLKKLSLNGKTLDDETLPLLAGLMQLEELSTNESQLSDDGYKHFAALTNLRKLSLWHPSWGLKTFTGAGVAHLDALPKLERLTFAGSTASDPFLEGVGKLTRLKDFSTWHTAQTQAGNKHLQKLQNLAVLRIGQRLPKWRTDSPASFDKATIPILAGIPSLERLELFEARFTYADLLPLGKLPKLKQLVIHTTDISPADVERLQTALAGVKIDFKPLTDEQRESTLVKKLRL